MVEKRYQIKDELGNGGMGTVYLALDTHTDQLVALKVLRRVPEDPKTLERFEREINIALTLDHPNVLRALAKGNTKMRGTRLPYLVSPYLPDGTLDDLIYKQKKPPWKYWKLLEIADAIQQAADGLGYMHSQIPPIIHRDVKPGNFLLEAEKAPNRQVHLYLNDFGISRQQYDRAELASGILGTYAYMAPEQASMKVDAASDQYALAIMACLLLTGHYPLRADNDADFLHAHLYEQPDRPTFLNPNRLSSSEIDHVILKALSKKPQDRYPTITDFARALYNAIKKQVLLTSSADTFVVSGGGSDASPPLAEPSLVNNPLYSSVAYEPGYSHNESSVDIPLPPRPGRQVKLSSIEAPQLERLPAQQLLAKDLPARVKQIAWSPDGSSLACQLFGHDPLIVKNNGTIIPLRVQGTVQTLCWSPDGQYLALSLLSQSRTNCEVRFWCRDTQTFAPPVLSFPVKSLEGMDWSRQSQLAIWADTQVSLYNLSPSTLRGSSVPRLEVFPSDEETCGSSGGLRWSPDGAFLVAGSVSGKVLCWRAGMSMPLWRKDVARQRIYCIAWYPDSSAFAVSCGDKRVVMLSARKGQGERLHEWSGLAEIPRVLSISPKSSLALAFSQQLLFGDLAADHPTHTLEGQQLVAWSPMGDLLATLDARKNTRLLVWGQG